MNHASNVPHYMLQFWVRMYYVKWWIRIGSIYLSIASTSIDIGVQRQSPADKSRAT